MTVVLESWFFLFGRCHMVFLDVLYVVSRCHQSGVYVVSRSYTLFLEVIRCFSKLYVVPRSFTSFLGVSRSRVFYPNDSGWWCVLRPRIKGNTGLCISELICAIKALDIFIARRYNSLFRNCGTDTSVPGSVTSRNKYGHWCDGVISLRENLGPHHQVSGWCIMFPIFRDMRIFFPALMG